MGMLRKDPEKRAEGQAAAAATRANKDAKVRAAALKSEEAARKKAQKKGIDVSGSVAVGYVFDDSADKFLVVFPDRVELINRGKMGSLLRAGAGAETVPTSRISSVESRNKGIWNVLEIHTSGNVVEFKADHVSGPYLREVILEQVGGGTVVPAGAAPSTPDAADQLKKLAALHADGILTKEEFNTKKAELLDRM
ncbi:SHOCT domain-containing protein [Georgenia satyanarayanai]|uniref:SHOCT domain-containing protein n=1 Tax=Georgenia satyanarayanai TaxID=860221 RepID=UPI00203AE14B|nr:SHOCT domain-containing protein [Georgenia satyanarayanai]MCM3662499.1 SHOCT domain-containing protein [Georgenia satyanarayanai]